MNLLQEFKSVFLRNVNEQMVGGEKLKKEEKTFDAELAEDERTPNDDRSDSMNPNNPAYQAAQDNRSRQMNPNNSAHRNSRGK